MLKLFTLTEAENSNLITQNINKVAVLETTSDKLTEFDDVDFDQIKYLSADETISTEEEIESKIFLSKYKYLLIGNKNVYGVCLYKLDCKIFVLRTLFNNFLI